MTKLTITIDGPAASGKSTTAREVAKQLQYSYIDTGAMYRALTLKVLKNDIALDDSQRIAELIDKTSIELRYGSNGLHTYLDDEDVSEEIRHPRVTQNLGPVVEIPRVREVMVKLQQEMGKNGGVVVEGRDMGTVVFPDAELKIFMIAKVEERAKRRQKELVSKGIDVDFQKLVEEIEARDKRDSTRAQSPLKPAPDAVLLDTSDLSIEEQVDFIVQKAKAYLKREMN